MLSFELVEPGLILAYLAALIAAASAFVAILRGRHCRSHWLLFGGLFTSSLESLFSGFAVDAAQPEEMLYWLNWKLLAISLLPALWLAFSLTYARGNARESLRKHRLILIGAILFPPALASGMFGKLIVLTGRTGAEARWIVGLGAPAICLHISVLVVGVLILINLERTFRATIGIMRWRIKFMVLAAAVLWAVRGFTSSQSLLFHAENLRLQALGSAALIVACVLLMCSLGRAGRFEVSVIPSTTLRQGSFTILFGVLYLVAIATFSKAEDFLASNFIFQIKSILILLSLVLLSLLVLSEKARSCAARFVRRHFHRSLYDYRTIWRNFTQGTARRLEQTELSEGVVKVVSEIFQALSVTIWLLDDRKERFVFGASTAFSRAKANQLQLEHTDLALVLEGLKNHPQPLDIDSSKAIWAVLLRQLHPDQFRKGGNRICIPIVSGGELLGLLILGDRVRGNAFWPQDFDLLKTISDQAAACLLNIQLSQKLLQAKQMEAFQTMSTFFVHDLKNTASTLSLMLQNLPVHFSDPAFREDALRGVSRTVTHINNLIGRLSLFRQEISLQAVESDLNEVVTAALKRMENVPTVDLARELRPLPRVRVDPSQIESLVTNLVLNARDAVQSAGRIKVETSRQNACVVLSVSDNGCGMTPEFVQQSLFRPFQSTKQKGIGVGMFQCKSIVEAHQGRIEVDTEIGKGTVFRVLLPVPALT
jgi:putative PEP-CTERM system histidine kinase